MGNERARQFLPFAALRGYLELIRNQEKIWEERPILSEEQQEQIAAALQQLKPGMSVALAVYQEGTIQNREGRIKKVDFSRRTLTLEDQLFSFSDLIELEIQESLFFEE